MALTASESFLQSSKTVPNILKWSTSSHFS